MGQLMTKVRQLKNNLISEEKNNYFYTQKEYKISFNTLNHTSVKIIRFSLNIFVQFLHVFYITA